MISRDKSHTVHSAINKISWLQIFFSVYIISNKTFLCRHIVNTNNFSAFESTTVLLLNQSVIQTQSGSQNERRYSNVCVILCNYMCVYDSYWFTLPMDRTDFREKRERNKGRMGREMEIRAEGRIQPPFSLFFFQPLLPSLLSSLLHTIFTMPFQCKMRIKLCTTYQTWSSIQLS